MPPPAKRRRGPPPCPRRGGAAATRGAAEFPPGSRGVWEPREQDKVGRGPSSLTDGAPRGIGVARPEGPAAKRAGRRQGCRPQLPAGEPTPPPPGNQPRSGPAGRPVPGKEQSEVELGHSVPLPTRGTSFRLRICCRSSAATAAAAPLAFHPAAIHRRGLRESAWGGRRGRAPEMLPQRALAYRLLRSPHFPQPPSPSAGALFLLPQRPCQVTAPLQSQGTGDGRGGARVVPAPDVAYGSGRPGSVLGYAPYWRSRSCLQRGALGSVLCNAT